MKKHKHKWTPVTVEMTPVWRLEKGYPNGIMDAVNPNIKITLVCLCGKIKYIKGEQS